ncbi:hypothetical protein AVEN_263769-1 [Araneus ventricosus]|uniref:Uncharacterized protein n=1 Tax=Araneus ventricosus TaxID=182803 RepID=A0A4Y2AS63_ARAVE|nr:hypothetical protein AVEN_263769-1 [Araneus ventricosus]
MISFLYNLNQQLRSSPVIRKKKKSKRQIAESSTEGEDQDEAVTQDDSDVDMEEFMTGKIQQTNEVEATSVMKGRASLKDVLRLKDCSREVGEHVVFRYEGGFFPGKIVSITENGVNNISMQRTFKPWKWTNKSDVMEYL